MKILEFKELSFSLVECDILRITQYAKHRDKIYFPKGLEFYKVLEDSNFDVDFEGNKYYSQEWIAVTEYSKEMEKIIYNMHYDIFGDKDDFLVVNSFSLSVTNIANKYLIYYLTGVPLDDDFPQTNELPKFSEPIYLVEKCKTECVEDSLYTIAGILGEQGINIDFDSLENKIYKSYLYIKIHGLSNCGDQLDCTTIQVRSGYYNSNERVIKIEREFFDIDVLSIHGDKFNKINIIPKEEFEKITKETINKLEL